MGRASSCSDRLIALDSKSTSCFDAGSGFTSIGFDCLASWMSCSGAVNVSGLAGSICCAAFETADESGASFPVPSPCRLPMAASCPEPRHPLRAAARAPDSSGTLPASDRPGLRSTAGSGAGASDLRCVGLGRVRLGRVDLRRVQRRRIDLRCIRLRGVNLRRLRLRRIGFRCVHLRRVDRRRLNLGCLDHARRILLWRWWRLDLRRRRLDLGGPALAEAATRPSAAPAAPSVAPQAPAARQPRAAPLGRRPRSG